MKAAGRSAVLGALAGFLALAALFPPRVATAPGGGPAVGGGTIPPALQRDIVYAAYTEGGARDATGILAVRAADGQVTGRIPQLGRSVLFFERGGRVLGLRRPEKGPGVQLVEFDPWLRHVRRVLYWHRDESWIHPLVPEFAPSPLVAGRFHLLARRGPDAHVIIVDTGSAKVLREINLGRISLDQYSLSVVPGSRGSRGGSASLLLWRTDWEELRETYVEVNADTGRITSMATFDLPQSECLLQHLSPATWRDGRLWEEVYCLDELPRPGGVTMVDLVADRLRQVDLRTGRVVREVDIRLACGDGTFMSCAWDQTLQVGPGGRHLYRVGLERGGPRAFVLRVDLDTGAKEVRVSSPPSPTRDGETLGSRLGRLLAGLFSSRVSRASGFAPPWSRERVLSPDGSRLFTSQGQYAGEPQGGIRVFDTRTLGQVAHLLPEKEVWQDAYALSPDGRRLFVLERAHRILAVDAATGRVLKEMALPGDVTLTQLLAVGRAPLGGASVDASSLSP